MASVLGFNTLPTAINMTHTSDSAVRLNSQKWVILNLKGISGASNLYSPLTNSVGSYMLPLYAASTDISYLGPQDLKGQKITIDSGTDVCVFQIELKRLDTNREFQLTADTSFLLEFTHES